MVRAMRGRRDTDGIIKSMKKKNIRGDKKWETDKKGKEYPHSYSRI